MEELIRNSISQYNDFIAEAHLYEKWLMQTDDPELKNQLSLFSDDSYSILQL